MQDEKEMLAKLRQGSASALAWFFKTYSEQLFYCALGFVRDKAVAEDLVQEVFVRLWEGREKLKVEGAVGVRVNGKEEVRLKPSQLAEYNAESGLVSVREVDAREYVAWKDGFFVFDDESLEEIMGTLSRWYDVEVFYVNEGAKELHFTGHLKRYDDIDVILRAIESAVDVTFSVNGRMVSVAR